MPLYKNVAVFVKPTESLTVPLTVLIEVLEKAGAEVYLDERSAETLRESRPSAGTPATNSVRSATWRWCWAGTARCWGVARSLAPYRRPIIGINAGRLGFITDIVFDEVREVPPRCSKAAARRTCGGSLAGEIIRDGKVLYRNVAVNDIGVTHGRAGGMVDFVIDVNGQQMSSQSTDGIICSTATGSTAYALASAAPSFIRRLTGWCWCRWHRIRLVAPHRASRRPHRDDRGDGCAGRAGLL